jgi:RNA polymerase primary sigma factor
MGKFSLAWFLLYISIPESEVMKMTNVKVKKEENNLAFFLKEINRIPMLSREDEEKTARAAAAGSNLARERLINANLRFVVNIAKKYQGLGLPLEDLIAEGNIGLVNAVDRFDVEKNCRFISYAVWWIRQSILSALCEKSRMIRLPTNRAAELVRIEKAKKMIKKQYSADEEAEEIADLLNMDKDHVVNLMSVSKRMLSLDTPVPNHQDSLLMDIIEDNRYTAPDKCAEQNIMEEEIENVLDTLEKNEADIIRCHYGIGRLAPMSLKEIGMRYNLSKERIRQIEEKALARLQNPVRKKKLHTYVA